MFKALLWIHRWLGLTIGFYFVLLGLSGSYLVYREPLQAWFYSEVRSASGFSGPLNFTAAIHSAQNGLRLPSDKGPTRLWVSEDSERNLELGFSGLPGMEKGVLLAFVDPSDNLFKGTENFRETLGGKIFFFHHDFFLGRTGRTIMAVAGFMMLALLLGGLYLWWPRRQTWKKALTFGPTKTPLQMQLQLHKVLGFYTLVLMLVVTFSGVYLSRPDWFQTMPPRKASSAEVLHSMSAVNFASLPAALEKIGPKPWDVRIDYAKAVLKVTSGKGLPVELDAHTLSFISSPQAEVSKSVKSMRSLQHDLHSGDFWGSIGEFLIFVSGLLPAVFYFSGLYIWLKKKR